MLVITTDIRLKCQKLKQKNKSTTYWTPIHELTKMILEELNKEIEDDDKDAINRFFDFLRDLSDSVQEEFDKLLAGDSNKKSFVRVLSRNKY